MLFFSQEVKRPSTVFASQEPCGAHKYAYVANVCVSKFARRHGIASNMLYLATDVATLSGTRFPLSTTSRMVLCAVIVYCFLFAI